MILMFSALSKMVSLTCIAVVISIWQTRYVWNLIIKIVEVKCLTKIKWINRKREMKLMRFIGRT